MNGPDMGQVLRGIAGRRVHRALGLWIAAQPARAQHACLVGLVEGCRPTPVNLASHSGPLVSLDSQSRRLVQLTSPAGERGFTIGQVGEAGFTVGRIAGRGQTNAVVTQT